MFFQHFIECIFHFNNYEKHEKYNKFPQSERSVRLLGSWGSSGRSSELSNKQQAWTLAVDPGLGVGSVLLSAVHSPGEVLVT